MDRHWSEFGGSGDDVWIQVRFTLTNNCGEAVKGFLGDLVVRDAFGDVIASATWKENVRVPAGATVRGRSDFGIAVASWSENHDAARTTPTEDMALEYTPQVVLLKDGTKIT